MLDPLKLALTVHDYSDIINTKEEETIAAAAEEEEEERKQEATNEASSAATKKVTNPPPGPSQPEEEAVSKLAYQFYTYQFESPFLKTDIPDTRARGTSRNRSSGTRRSNRSGSRSRSTHNANPPPQGQSHQELKPKLMTASIYRPPLLVQLVDEEARLAPSLGAASSSSSSPSVSFAVNMKQVCEMLSYVAIYNLALCHQLKVVQLAQQDQAEQQHQQQQMNRLGGAVSRGETINQLGGAAIRGGFRSSVTSRKRRKRMLVCLKKALGLYEHSHQILMNQQHHEELATGSKNTSHFILHKMVLVTNLGQIHHSLKDHAKGDLCMDHLVAIVTNVKNKEENVVETIFEGSAVTMNGFFQVAAPYTTRHDHAAAA